MLPPCVAVAVRQPSIFPGERSTPGTVPGGRPSPGDTEVQWERDTSTPGAPPREDGSFPGRHPGVCPPLRVFSSALVADLHRNLYPTGGRYDPDLPRE